MKNQPSFFRRIFSLGAALAASLSAPGQTTPQSNPAQTRSDKEETVQLSAFEVTMTEDKGYSHGNSMGALKTEDRIFDIPQSLQVMTRDMIDDIGGGNKVSNILNYAGVGNGIQGDNAVVRGQSVTILADGGPDGNFDLAQVDSITIIKGPAAALYGLQASLSGTILKTTRVPLYKRQATITSQIREWGAYRNELDATGPIKVIGEHKFGYRFTVAHMGGKAYFKNDEIDRISTYGVVEYRNPRTVVRVNGAWVYSENRPHQMATLRPDGLPYVGAGRDESYMSNNMDTNPTSWTGRVHFAHRLGDGWDLQARAAYSYYQYRASVLLTSGNGSTNYQANERLLIARRNESTTGNTGADWTINGKYRLFGLNASTLFGMVYHEPTTSVNFFPGDPTFGTDNATNGVGFRAVSASVLAVPLNNPQMDRIRLRTPDEYDSILTTPARGTRNLGTRLTMFAQQTVEVIPNRLTAVAGISQFNYYQQSENVTSPPPATITATSVQRQHGNPYSLGLVFKVTKAIAIYATKRTTMAPQSSQLIDGTRTPPQKGDLQEIGIKTDILDGRFSSTFSVFDNDRTNVAVAAAGVSPITGANYVTLIGQTTSSGVDMNLSWRPLSNWQLSFSANKVKVRDRVGNRIAGTNGGAWGLLTRYDFTSGALRKFSIGGGGNRFYDRYTAATQIRLPDGTIFPGLIKLKEKVWTNVFVQYRPIRNLSVTLVLENVLDVLYARGATHAGGIDISEPRNVTLRATYRF